MTSHDWVDTVRNRIWGVSGTGMSLPAVGTGVSREQDNSPSSRLTSNSPRQLLALADQRVVDVCAAAWEWLLFNIVIA
ncbi:MAG: hypothetical protein PsegKO_18920 [Pseudohongiellaceae bacterium]